MLISISKHFIFVANTKAASTTVEKLLKRHSDISITKTAYGKHLRYADIADKFGFIFSKSGVPADRYFRFGVIREPLDWVVSWYNYRCRKQLITKRHPNSCHGVSFETFAEELMKPKRNSPFARIGSQSAMFKDAQGNLGVDYLISLRNLRADLQAIGRAFNVVQTMEPDKVNANVSPKVIATDDVVPALANQLREYYAEDVELFNKADEGGFGDVAEIIRGKQNR